MEKLLEKIAQVDEMNIEQLLQAVLNRYQTLFPEWEIVTVSIARNQDKNQQLGKMIQFLEGLQNPQQDR